MFSQRIKTLTNMGIRATKQNVSITYPDNEEMTQLIVLGRNSRKENEE